MTDSVLGPKNADEYRTAEPVKLIGPGEEFFRWNNRGDLVYVSPRLEESVRKWAQAEQPASRACVRCGKTLINGRGGCEGAEHGNRGCAMNNPQAEQPATITECEACFTPDACQLRGKCDHYAAERIRVQKAEQPASHVLTDKQLLEIADPFGAFEFGDAQGHKRIAFARAVLAAALKEQRCR